MRRLRGRTLLVMAGLAFGLLAFELIAGAVSHDPVAHGQEPERDHSCVVCMLGQADEAGPPIEGELLSPLTARTCIAAPHATPYTPSFRVLHPARGPPADRA